MLNFILRRLLTLIPVLLGLSIMVFAFVHALPGSPADSLLGERGTEKDQATIEKSLGLDRPLPVQYLFYMRNLLSGDLGTSVSTRRPVTEELGRYFPATVELGVAAMIFAIVLGVPLGFVAAKRYLGLLDNTSLFISLIGISFPVFFLGLLLKYVFAVKPVSYTHLTLP